MDGEWGPLPENEDPIYPSIYLLHSSNTDEILQFLLGQGQWVSRQTGSYYSRMNVGVKRD